MKAILLTLAIGVTIGITGARTVATQSSASAQAGASAQSQTSVEGNKSGAKAAGSGSASSSASASADKSPANIGSGTKIDATLVNSLDVKKNKPGDRVEARTAQDVKQDGKVVLKKGTPLIGHVTQAQARTKEQAQSQLGIVFDHAVLKGGEEMPLTVIVQALAASQSSASAASAASDAFAGGGGSVQEAGASGGGGLLGGVGSTVGETTGAAGGVVNTAASATGNAGGTLNAATRSTGAVGGLTSSGRLASNSNGVFGLEGLSLNMAASNATDGSMIVSPNKNVHLDGGTQMLLSVTGQAQ